MLHIIFFGGNGRRPDVKASTANSSGIVEAAPEQPSGANTWAARGPLAVLCAVLAGLSERSDSGKAHAGDATDSSASHLISSTKSSEKWPLYLHSPTCPCSTQQPPLPEVMERLQQQLSEQEQQQQLLHLLVPLLVARSRTFALCCLWKTTRRPRRLASFLGCMQRAMRHAPPCSLPPQIYCSAVRATSRDASREAVKSSLVAHTNSNSAGRLASPFMTPGVLPQKASPHWETLDCLNKCGQLRDPSTGAASDSGVSIRSCRMQRLTPSPEAQSGEGQHWKTVLKPARQDKCQTCALKRHGRVNASLNARRRFSSSSSSTESETFNILDKPVMKDSQIARRIPEDTKYYRSEVPHGWSTCKNFNVSKPEPQQQGSSRERAALCQQGLKDGSTDAASQRATPVVPKGPWDNHADGQQLLQQGNLQQQDPALHCVSTDSSTAPSLTAGELKGGNSRPASALIGVPPDSPSTLVQHFRADVAALLYIGHL